MPAKNWQAVTKFGIDDGLLARISGFLTHIKPDLIFREVLLFNLLGKSDTEIRFKAIGKAMIEQATGQQVIFSGYEWLTFKIPGGAYTADWYYLLDNGQWACVEVKASKYQRNYRDARSKLRAVASLNPWFKFYEARPNKNDWTLEKIDPEPDFLATFGQLIQEIES